MFDGMFERNVVSWNSLLEGYIRCGDIFKAMQVFYEMRMPYGNVISWTAIIAAGLAQNGRFKQKLFLYFI